MGNFKISLKTVLVAVLVTICAFLLFDGKGQNEESSTVKNPPADFAAPSSLQVNNVPLAPPLGKEPVMPRGFNPNATWRDPFAAPPALSADTAKKAAPPPPPAENSGDFTQPKQTEGNLALPEMKEHPAELPRLVGIVSSANRQMAIIHHKGLSRAYGLGENVGIYQLIKITEDAAILESLAGRVTIRLSGY